MSALTAHIMNHHGDDRLAAEVGKLEEDAARYRWLTEDHADPTTRGICREILRRLPLMSYSAASMAIDSAMETPNV
jgi:hypothetical protein